MNKKNLHVQIEKAASEEFDGSFVMSASTPDRVSDTIDPKAYDNALKSDKLVALWQHDPNKPVGYWADVKRVADTLRGNLKVANTNLGLMIKQLIADGVPLGASIGFRGKGEPNKAGGIHFKEIELMETSIVSIPAHPRAMQIAKSYGYEEFVEVQSSDQDDVPASGPNAEEILHRARSATLQANKTLRKGMKK